MIQNHSGNCSVKESIDLINTVGDERFRLVFSPDHCINSGEELSDIYSLVKPVTRQIYIADVLNTEHGYINILPGKGCVPIAEVCSALGGKDFEGYLTFKWEKIWDPSLEEPEIALPYFIEYIKSILGSGI